MVVNNWSLEIWKLLTWHNFFSVTLQVNLQYKFFRLYNYIKVMKDLIIMAFFSKKIRKALRKLYHLKNLYSYKIKLTIHWKWVSSCQVRIVFRKITLLLVLWRNDWRIRGSSTCPFTLGCIAVASNATLVGSTEDLDGSVIAPIGAPGVFDQPVINSIFISSVTKNKNSVVDNLRGATWEDAISVVSKSLVTSIQVRNSSTICCNLKNINSYLLKAFIFTQK